MRRLFASLAAIGLLSGLAPAAFAQSPGDVIVHIENVRSSKGRVRVELCTAETFLTSECVLAGSAPARAGETTVILSDVPPGTYAVQAFHDENGDGKLNRNALGIPREDIGFSREAPIGLHGPQFMKAAFNHAGDEQVIQLRLRRF